MTQTFRASHLQDRGAGIQWRSWGTDAFDEAERGDRPVLLCLSAVWCESCARMDRTTYADPAVTELVNGDLIPIRVDSDWYPHVQDRYIAGGWPTTAFLTPTGEVLWAGTYVDPEQFRSVATAILTAWRERRADLQREIDRRRKAMDAARSRHASVGLVRREAADDVLSAAHQTFDARNGGFGEAPKFPQPHAIEMLLVLGWRTGNPDWIAMAEQTLDGMLAGELWDAGTGGFFRYALEADWTRPRAEKLLETNAALMRAYALGAKVRGRADWRSIAESVVTWVERTLRRADGLYAGSIAADPAWVGDGGNSAADPVAYTDGNALWIRALADAGGWFGRTDWTERAAATLDALLETMTAPDDTLYHYLAPDSPPAVPGLLADLFETGAACLAVAQATGRADYVERARRIARAMEQLLWADGGGFMDYASSTGDAGALRYSDRPFEMNAHAARFLLDLSLATGERGCRATAERTLALLSPHAGRYGVAGAAFALAVDEFFEPPFQVVIVGNDETAADLRRAALALQEPGGRVWTLEQGGRIGQSEYPPQDGGAAYLCRARSRSRPVRLPGELLAVAAAAH